MQSDMGGDLPRTRIRSAGAWFAVRRGVGRSPAKRFNLSVPIDSGVCKRSLRMWSTNRFCSFGVRSSAHRQGVVVRWRCGGLQGV